MIDKLKRKFILINMVLVSIVLIVTYIGVYVSTYNKMINTSKLMLEKTLDEKGKKESPKRKIGGEKSRHDSRPSLNKLTFLVELDNENNIIYINDDNIEIIDEEALDEIVSECIESKEKFGIIYDEDLRFLKNKTDNKLEIAFIDRSEEINTLNSLFRASLLVGLGSLSAFLIISIFLSRWAIKPAEEAFNRQKQFIADASHELKTPITVILANTEVLLSHKDDVICNQIKWIEYIKLESERMRGLVDDLLFLAKLDYKDNIISFEQVNLSEVVLSVILPFESLVFEKHKNLEINIEPEILFTGNEKQLKQLGIILIDNAIKYCNDNGIIKINLTKVQNKINLSVNNSGVTISKEDQNNIFERFYRVDKSRVRENGGYGLGLSIAKEIVELHKGQISVTSNDNYGTIFKVTLPSN